jgi:hypothetical protein
MTRLNEAKRLEDEAMREPSLERAQALAAQAARLRRLEAGGWLSSAAIRVFKN